MTDNAQLYRRILVPLDGSEIDQAILSHIIRLAHLCGSEVVLLRVGLSQPWDVVTHEAEKMEAYLAERKAQLEEQGIPTRALFIPGDPAHVILRQADKLACDLIAMSTHGHGALMDLLVGSVAHKVRHSTHIPVLLIRA